MREWNVIRSRINAAVQRYFAGGFGNVRIAPERDIHIVGKRQDGGSGAGGLGRSRQLSNFQIAQWQKDDNEINGQENRCIQNIHQIYLGSGFLYFITNEHTINKIFKPYQNLERVSYSIILSIVLELVQLRLLIRLRTRLSVPRH